MRLFTEIFGRLLLRISGLQYSTPRPEVKSLAERIRINIDRQRLFALWTSMGIKTLPFYANVYDKRPRSLPVMACYIPFINCMVLMRTRIIIFLASHFNDAQEMRSFVMSILAHETQHMLQCRRYGPWVLYSLRVAYIGAALLIGAWLTLGLGVWIRPVSTLGWFELACCALPVLGVTGAVGFALYQRCGYPHEWTELDAKHAWDKAPVDPRWHDVVRVFIIPE